MPEEQERSGVNRRPLVSLLSASGMAWFGNTVTMVVVPWLVYQTTGSASLTGLVGFAAALPLVLAGLFGGVFIDRLGPARAAVLAESMSGLFLLLIPLSIWSVGYSTWMVLVLVFVSNLFSAPGMTARRSLVPDVAAPASMSLDRANSLDQLFNRMPLLIGPPIAGALMVIFSPESVILLAVVTIWLSGMAIQFGVPATRASSPGSTDSRSYVGDLLDGLRFVLQDRLMRAIAIILAVTNLLEAPVSVIAPIYADRHLGGSVDLGLIFAALGCGMMIGITIYAVFGSRLPRRPTFIVGLMGIGASYWILATLPGLWVTLAVLFGLGLIAGPINPLLATVQHERVPVEMRGRVFGLIGAVALSMMPIGRLLGGLSIEWIGLSGTLLVQAVGFALCGVVIVMLPVLRLLDDPAASSTETSEVMTPQPGTHSS